MARFLQIFSILSLILVLSAGVTHAQQASVCDPAIEQMLEAASKAQIKTETDIINAAITRPRDVFDLSCAQQTTDALQAGTTRPSNTICQEMENAWKPPATPTAPTPAPTASTTVFDPIDLMTAATDPVSQVADTKCHPGIPTGVKINGKNEIVCPNPGCFAELDKDSDKYVCKKY